MNSYTPELQVKLYAGVTGRLLKLRLSKQEKLARSKTIRRSYRQNYTPELQVNEQLYAGVTGETIRRSYR
jgi:hypothetical protein